MKSAFLLALFLTVGCSAQNSNKLEINQTTTLPMNQTTITLNNGVVIPQFGLGVYSIPAGETTYNSVLAALKPDTGTSTLRMLTRTSAAWARL